MALLTLLVFFILGFFAFGSGGGSTSGVTDVTPAPTVHHAVKCSARMKAPTSAWESRRNDCGGPPANP